MTLFLVVTGYSRTFLPRGSRAKTWSMLTTLLCCSNEIDGASFVAGSICWNTSLKLNAPSLAVAAVSSSAASMEISSEYVSGSSGVASSPLPAAAPGAAAAAAAVAVLLNGVQAGTGPLLLLLLLLWWQAKPSALGGRVVAESCRSSTGAFLPPAMSAVAEGSEGVRAAGVGVRSEHTHWL